MVRLRAALSGIMGAGIRCLPEREKKGGDAGMKQVYSGLPRLARVNGKSGLSPLAN
jgi:hypothetical protein